MKRLPNRQLQFTVIFFIFLIGFLSWTLVLTLIYVVGRESLKERIGGNFQKIAEETSGNLSFMIDEHIVVAQALALSQEILHVVEGTDRRHTDLALKTRLAQQRAAWEQGEANPKVRAILDNPASNFLRRYLRNVHEREQHYLLFVTDADGFLVAADTAPTHAYFGNQPWWKAALDKGRGSTYVSDIEETSLVPGKEGTYLMTIAVPVMDPYEGRAIGVLAMVHPVLQFFELVTRVKVGQTDHTMLADSEGNLLFCPIFLIKNHQLEAGLINTISQEASGWGVTHVDVHYPHRESINGFAPVRIGQRPLHPSSLGGNQWYIFTSQDPQETYEPIRTLLLWTAGGGTLGIAMLAFFGIYLTRRIIRPIHALKEGTRRLGAGEHHYRINIQTGDEIEELAKAFNAMASRIEESYLVLEQKVAERTADLERRNEELSSLNQIVSTLGKSLNLHELLNEVLRKVLETFQVAMGTIHLWDTEEGALLLKASQGLSEEDLEPIRHLSVDNEGFGKSVQTGHPVFLGHAPGDFPAAIHGSLPGPFPKEARSALLLPLRQKGKTVGVLSLLDLQPRVYHPQDHQLLRSICAQIAVATENARLFEETKMIDQLKSDFVSKVSHEFRTPLTSIRGFSEILLTYGEIPESQKEFIQIISQESDRMTRLINDVLDLAKIESGKIDWSIHPTDLGEIVTTVCRSLRSIAEEKGLALHQEISESLPLAYADRDQLIQVINNLLSNAIKFTHTGEINVSARRKGDREIQVDVSDTGIGIPGDEVGRIFEKFHQVAPASSQSPKGTGLGLAICREIIQRLGGRIWCESTENRGTTFSFTLKAVGQTDPAIGSSPFRGEKEDLRPNGGGRTARPPEA